MIQKEFDRQLSELTQDKVNGKKFLLAVSGGIDSMCMASLFLNSSLHPVFSVAHVNFLLRGEDSNLDQHLVKSWADEHGIPFLTTTFDTLDYSKKNSISIEMAARDLRYGWFYELMDEYNFDYLVIAHNQDDSVETLFLNLLRGTGMRGLSGIKNKNGKIIRPLLAFSRKQISEYVDSNHIGYRDDKTNFDTDFSRNKLRNVIFPEMKKINPSFHETVQRNISYFTQANDILDDLFNERKKRFMTIDGDIIIINIEKLKKDKHFAFWLFRILNEKGFNSSQVVQIKNALDGQSGKSFKSHTHDLIINRGMIEVYPITVLSDEILTISQTGNYIYKGRELKFNMFVKDQDFSPVPVSGQLFFAADNIKFPIICRGWRTADKFRPFGMQKGSKKLSDFFTDMKMSKRDKEMQPILVAGDDIVCLPGLRIDDRYKITTSTTIIAEVVLIP